MFYARVDIYLPRFMNRNGNERGPDFIGNARIIYTYKLRFSTLIEFMRPAYQSARC